MRRLFDLDGTLFWSSEFIKVAYEDAYLNSGLNIPYFTKKISNLYSHSLKNYLKILNVDKKLISEYSSILSKIKNQSFSKFSNLLVPNRKLIKELINNQESSYIISNASFVTACNYLSFFEIDFPKDHIFTREKLIATKPNKFAYLTIMKMFNNEQKYVVYEDSEEGICSAKEAGISNIIKVSYDKKQKKWEMKKYV